MPQSTSVLGLGPVSPLGFGTGLIGTRKGMVPAPGECVLSLSKVAARQNPLCMQVNPQWKMCFGSQFMLGKAHSHRWWLRVASLTNSIILTRMIGPWKPLLLQCMHFLCHRTAGQGRVMSEHPGMLSEFIHMLKGILLLSAAPGVWNSSDWIIALEAVHLPQNYVGLKQL